jgi:YVTN family beta-propeller protein
MSLFMNSKNQRSSKPLCILLLGLVAIVFPHDVAFAQFFPTHSSPIDITPNGSFVWMVNPDNNSVSIFDVRNDANVRLGLIPVGIEPQSVAIHPSGNKAYVTNMVSGTVSAFQINQITGAAVPCKTIKVGTEPYGAAVTPNGAFLYVANASSNTVSVIDTNTVTNPDCSPSPFVNPVIKTIAVDRDPRGIAITADNFNVYVTHFFPFLRPDKTAYDEGRDDAKEGRVTLISTIFQSVQATIALNPMLDTGFLADGSTLGRDPCQVTGCTNQRTVTGAYPNFMQSITIKGAKAYLPNTATSPNGPVRFNVNVQSFLSVFDTFLNKDLGQTINMHKGIGAENETTRLFITNPFAIAFKRFSDEGYVTAKAINQIIRVTLNSEGTPGINAPTPVRVNVGKDPRGIVFNPADTRAYIMNYISRDMSVVDISTSAPTLITTVVQPDLLPVPGSLDEVIHRGKELFNTSIGPAGTASQSDPPAGRMSSEGWGSCFGCHEDGRSDNETWMFADGPRQTVSMDSTFTPLAFDPAGFAKQRMLNHSAVRDEVQDFELNIRGVSGGQGLITDGQPVVNLAPTGNTGRSPDLDAINLFIDLGVRTRIAPPLSKIDNPTGIKITSGRTVFVEEGCANCHGGSNWTSSILDFTPPALAVDIVDAQLIRFLKNVGTFDLDRFQDGRGNEIRAGTVGVNVQARGLDGFNTPSLLGVFATAPYFHDGSAQTLEEAIVETPRRAGDVHVVSNPIRRFSLLRFLKTIDEGTPPITPTGSIPTPLFYKADPLNNANEVPPVVVPTTATGTCSFSQEGSFVTFQIDVSNITGVTAAHIHSGAAGVAGPVRVTLFNNAAGFTPATSPGVLVKSVFQASDVSGISFNGLIAEMTSGNAYCNVHTLANTAGEIRSQIFLEP